MNARNRVLRHRLTGIVSRLLGPDVALPETLALDQQLSDLGLSSLKMVNLMLEIEVEFAVAIPPAEITPETFHSLDTVAALIERLMPP